MKSLTNQSSSFLSLRKNQQAISYECAVVNNWSFKELAEVETNFSSNDTKSVIFIGDTVPPDPNGDTFLMRTYLAGYQKSCDNGNKIVYYVDNMDVEVNPYYLFAYDCSDIDTSGNVNEFYNTLLHELGHCHMLQHNVEENELMYPYTLPIVDDPSSNDIAGGRDVIEFSLDWQSTGGCTSITIHDTVSCETNFINEYNTENKIKVYPNPFSEALNIEIKSVYSPNLYICIYDLTSRVLYSEDTRNTQPTKETYQINFNEEIPPGAYILRIISNNKAFSTIIIKG